MRAYVLSWGTAFLPDLVNEVAAGNCGSGRVFVVGSPVYYASANATLVALLIPPVYALHSIKR